MDDLEGRLEALGASLEDPRPAPKAAIERRAARLRQRRRLFQTAGAVAASLVVIAGTAAMLTRDDDTNDVSTNSTPSTEEATTSTTEATTPTTTTSTEAPPAPAQGDLASATTALRAACRQYYGFETDVDSPTTSVLTEAELVSRCDDPQPEFRSDCYAERPATFVPREGGCAVLHGYLAVYYGEPPDASDYANEPTHRFVVGDDVWWIYPESD